MFTSILLLIYEYTTFLSRAIDKFTIIYARQDDFDKELPVISETAEMPFLVIDESDEPANDNIPALEGPNGCIWRDTATLQRGGQVPMRGWNSRAFTFLMKYPSLISRQRLVMSRFKLFAVTQRQTNTGRNKEGAGNTVSERLKTEHKGAKGSGK